MTMFSDLSGNKKRREPRKTIFTHCINGNFACVKPEIEPTAYENVVFIGHDAQYGDVFKVWDFNEENFTIFFGVKGDEFNS